MPDNGIAEAATAGINGTLKPDEVERILSGEPLTSGYKPSLPAYLFWGQDGTTPNFFVLRDIEAMLAHPVVEMALSYYKSGIANAEFEVTSSDPEVQAFVQGEIETFWQKARVQVQHTYEYGWGGYEVCYTVGDDGLTHFEKLLDFHPLDVFALTRDHKYVGVSVRKVPDPGKVELWGPDHKYPTKGFWFAHRRRYSQWYGRSQLWAAWLPWSRLARRDGAQEIVDAAVYREGYQGPIGRYPQRDLPSRVPGAQPRSARDTMREIVEMYKAGGSVGLPSTRDDKGNLEWELEIPMKVLDVAPFLVYVEYLCKEINLGITIAPELIEAADTGSGYSGRAIPLEAYFTSQQCNAEAIVDAYKEQIGDPLVSYNFGPGKTYKINVKNLLKSRIEASKPPQEPGQGFGGQGPGPRGPTAPQGSQTYNQGNQFALPIPPVQLATAADPTRDLEDREAEAILRRALSALGKTTAIARKRLAEALKNPDQAQAFNQIRRILNEQRGIFTRTLSDAKLAAILAGAKRVVDRLGTMPVPPAPELPASLLPNPADALVEQARGLPAAVQEQYIKALLPETASYVETALRQVHQLGPPEPPWEPPVIAGEAEPLVRFPVIDEAVKDLQGRRLVTRDEFDQLAGAAHDEAFTVAGIESDVALGKVLNALTTATAEGKTLKEFEREVEDDLGKGSFLSDAHSETVFRTNIQTAYSRGMDKVLEHPLVGEAFPYEETIPIHDARLTELCEVVSKSGISGTGIFRRDDKVWQEFKPPRHFGCRCGRRAMSIRQAAKAGIKEAQDWLDSGEPPVKPAWVKRPDVELPKGWRGTQLSLGWKEEDHPRDDIGQFTVDPRYDPRSHKIVSADVSKLDRAFAKNKDIYIPKGGGGAEIPGRRKGFEDFLKTGKKIETPYLSYDKGEVDFINGRHRFSVLRDKGLKSIPVMIGKDAAKEFKAEFGSEGQ